MKLYPSMTPDDMVNCAVLMDAILKENYRLKACAKNNISCLYMEILNSSGSQEKAPSITYIARIGEGLKWVIGENSNPIEAVDEVMKEAGITKVQQYIDLKTLTESLRKGVAQ